MPKAKQVGPFGDNPPQVVFWCPACGHYHSVPYVNKRPHPQDRAVWFCDENWESPTIEPSLRVFAIDGRTTACHVVVTNGILNYCGDMPGPYAGKREPMREVHVNDDGTYEVPPSGDAKAV